jgi:hypothetical protein
LSTAAKSLVFALRVLDFLQDLQEKQRDDEQTRTADLISLRVIHQGLPRVANLAFPSWLLCSGLLPVEPYCVPGGIRVVSEVHRSRVAGPFANRIRNLDILGSLDTQVGNLTAARRLACSRPTASVTCVHMDHHVSVTLLRPRGESGLSPLSCARFSASSWMGMAQSMGDSSSGREAGTGNLADALSSMILSSLTTTSSAPRSQRFSTRDLIPDWALPGGAMARTGKSWLIMAIGPCLRSAAENA